MGKHKNLKERTAKGEKIGGGFIVMRRHTTTGRVHVSPIGMPFEYPTKNDAETEALRLTQLHPGKLFCTFQQVSAFIKPESEEIGQPKAAEQP